MFDVDVSHKEAGDVCSVISLGVAVNAAFERLIKSIPESAGREMPPDHEGSHLLVNHALACSPSTNSQKLSLTISGYQEDATDGIETMIEKNEKSTIIGGETMIMTTILRYVKIFLDPTSQCDLLHILPSDSHHITTSLQYFHPKPLLDQYSLSLSPRNHIRNHLRNHLRSTSPFLLFPQQANDNAPPSNRPLIKDSRIAVYSIETTITVPIPLLVSS